MNLATSYRRPTSDIVNALQAAVQAIQLPGNPSPGAAFGRVEKFDVEDLTAAFQFLLITEQRVCVIVPLDEKFKVDSKNAKLIVTRTLPVVLLISDRVLGKRQDALFGSETEEGAFALAELVLPAVTGQLLPNPSGVRCEPTSCYVMAVKETEKKLPNRVAVCLELNCVGGRLEAAVQPVT